MHILNAILTTPGFWALVLVVVMTTLFWSDFIVFVVVPSRLMRGAKGSERSSSIRFLERLNRLPTLHRDEKIKLMVWYRLGILYFLEGRFSEAAQQFQRFLDHLNPKAKATPGLEADARRRLADCLDALGKEGQGDQERQAAQQAVQGREDMLALKTQADLLGREHKYDEALAVYEQALAESGSLTSAGRAEIMVKMCLAAHHAGRIDQTIAWAEEAIANGAQGVHLRSAHSMAGLGYANLGNENKAEHHQQKAYELAKAQGDMADAARKLSMLASLKTKQGRFNEALQMADKSIAELAPTRVAYTVKSDILLLLGRFEEAREALLTGDSVREQGQNIAFFNKRQHAAFCIGLSRVLAYERKPADAWSALEEAYGILDGDAKLTLWCDATAARVLAMMGRYGEAEQMIRRVERGLDDFPDDRNSRLTCFSFPGFAAFEMQDYAGALDFWQGYLAAEPDLCWRPLGLYYVGECKRKLGDLAGARDAFAEADQLGLETYYSELARQALQQLPQG